MKYFFLGLLLSTFFHFQPSSCYKKVECYSDPVLCSAPVCTLKALSRNVKKLTVGCTPVYPLCKLQMHLMQMKKTSSNNWMPGLYDVTLDFCEMSMRNSTAYKFVNTLFGKLAPEKMDVLNQFLQPCPYKEKWEAISVMNISRQNVKMSSVVSDIFGRSEFKTFARVFDMQNRTVYELMLYYN